VRLRTWAAGAAAGALCAGALLGATGSQHGPARPGPALSVRNGGRWITWWQAGEAPRRWDGTAPLARHVTWQAGASGIEWGELELSGAGEAWRTRVVVVRMDPARVRLSVAPAFTEGQRWSVSDVAKDSGVVLALDAGQFRGSLPWGWVVNDGRELLAPQVAPLAGAVVVGAAGDLRLVRPEHVTDERARGGAREAFQSYPMLLHDGEVPAPLRKAGSGVDLEHRDARLALGTLSDGRVVLALTRFDALGAGFGRVPFGLTTPEMAAVMGALGCRDAIMLDGGISGQLMVREPGGPARVWPGTRSVPMGVVGRGRE